MKLLAIVPDQLSVILQKGELQPRYYNPGNLADEVHILMTNADQPDPAPLQYTVGNARLFLHNYPDDLTLPTRRFPMLDGWRLRRWARGGVELVRRIKPDIIRCHGADWNAYLASRCRKLLGIPYCVSLHINPDINPVRRFLSPHTPAAERHNLFYECLERDGLRHADMVLPVYRPILTYLHRMGVPNARIRVCYNILNGTDLHPKTTYATHSPCRMLYVGRLIAEKNPCHILEAVARISGLAFDIIGDGPLRPELEALAASLGIGDRVRFIPSVLNRELCRMLPDYDAFAVHTDYWELNKAVLEALLTGLPVVINRRPGEPVPELDGADFVHMVDNTADGYEEAIRRLMDDDAYREALGRRAYAHAQAHWVPALTEAAYVDVYKSLLGGNHATR